MSAHGPPTGRPAIATSSKKRKARTSTTRAAPRRPAKAPPATPASRARRVSARSGPSRGKGAGARTARRRAPREQPLGEGVGDAFAFERLGIPSPRGSDGGVRELSWVEFGGVIRDLAGAIADGFGPELVLGVARGGIFVGGALAAPLRAEFLPVRVEKRARDRHARPTGRIPEARGRKVLVVDDVTNTGSTLAKAKALALDSGARDVQAAVLVVRPGGSRPEWFAMETAQLIVFPWDYQLDASGPGGDPGVVGV